jgi:hypothetical protein
MRPTLARVTALALIALLAFACESREVIVTMTRDELQSRLASRFPIEKSAIVIDLLVKEPKLRLEDGSNRIGVEMVAEVSVLSKPSATGLIVASGVPRYDSDKKAFFLDQLKIESLELTGIKPEHEAKARALAEGLAHHALTRYPIYELKPRNLKEVGASFVLRSVLIRDGKLQATLALPM